MRIKQLISILGVGLSLALAGRAEAAQAQLAPGNGMWIKPATTPIIGNEAAMVTTFKNYNVKHVFVWAVGFTASDFAGYVPFIQQAHANGLTVHMLVATKASITSGGQPTATLLASALNEVVTHNTNHPEAPLDGVQIDIEAVSGSTLLSLVSAVSVPETLVFSAAVQPNEYYSGIESYYTSLLQTTDLDMLVPMIYTMDGIVYNNAAPSFTFGFTQISNKTSHILSLLPANGTMMAGLSAYDREFPIDKATGKVDTDYSDGFSQEAWSTSSSLSYTVPRLAANGKTLLDATNRTTTGTSIYRFDYNSNWWLDVIEMTPFAVRKMGQAANDGAAGNTKYVGYCTWLYHTVFDSNYSGRQEGLVNDDAYYPSPAAKIELISFQAGVARLRVSLTNAHPSEHVLGAHAGAGVHLRLQGGATFSGADAGTFHAVEAFNTSGAVLPAISGAQIIELRRSFFENNASQSAMSGEIAVNATGSFTLQYRSWMLDKDSICNDIGTAEPYIARSPDDVHYNSAAKFLTYAAYTTNIAAPSMDGMRYAATVLSNNPAAYYRFSETGMVTSPYSNTAVNSGTLGTAANGAASTNSSGTTGILALQSGALSDPANTAYNFPGGTTNRVVIPYQSSLNPGGAFSVEFWAKGGTSFTCPIASTVYDQSGWLFYQGNSSQTSGNGWWFRVYQSGSSPRVNAQADTAVSQNNWYHIVGVFDGSYARLYVNGSQVASTTVTTSYVPNTSPSTPLILGARSTSGDYAYTGSLDEVAVYTNALTPAQVAAHYAAATANGTGYPASVLQANPPGYWRLNDRFTPPTTSNSGSGGMLLNGIFLHSCQTIPGLADAGFPGLESTNLVLQLSGTNGQVRIPPLDLNTNTVTLECWMQRNGDQVDHAGLIMHRMDDGTAGCGLDFFGASNHLGYYWNDLASTYTWDSGLTPPDGQWVFAALAISPNRAVIYMFDGTTWSAATNFVANTNQAFAGYTRIGSDGGTNRFFAGAVDEVAIFNRTLTRDQLLAHAVAGAGGKPAFLQPPVSRTVQAGAAAGFNAMVAGDAPLSYSWQKNAVDIPGATNLSFGIAGADYVDAGQYQLVAMNTNGSTLSAVASLTVLPPSSVTNLTYRNSFAGAQPVLELIWPSGTLYSADTVTGIWSVVSDAAAPYYRVLVDTNTSQRFFRVEN